MNIAVAIVGVGLLVFLAHVFAEVFSRKRVPDVLLLIIIGLIIGPVLNIVNTEHLGLVGPVFTTITLVTILFEGGTELRFDSLRHSLRGTSLLTNLNFFSSMIVIGLLGWLILGFPPLVSFMLGAIVGGTSSAVVIPLVRQLKISNNSRTILILESAFSDVLCIIFALAFMEAMQLGQIQVGTTIGQILASFILASIMGLVGAFFWSVILHRIRNIKNSIFTTPAFVFIIYGLSEMLGYSGAISALAFGIGLANTDLIKGTALSKYFTKKPDSLNETERILFGEAVFLLKTFFFVYIGISVQISEWIPLLIGFAITVVLFLLRIPVVRVSMPISKDIHDKTDLMYMSTMIPKGLAAAVLATIPLQQGIEGGELIKNIVFSVILFSIVFTSVLIPLLERSKNTQAFYINSLDFNVWMRERIQRYQQSRRADREEKDRVIKEKSFNESFNEKTSDEDAKKD
ncbi:MAG: cation:proton antiporter [Bacteroidetes bacterium]|jgi:cell volume regulation protein A|nr:cation:proton antiporter [Bacteroidota bacterium]